MNAFARHGLDHLSASSLNAFVRSPALWVMERLLKRSAPVGAAAHRGTAAERGVTLGLINPEATDEDCIAEAQACYRQFTALSTDPGRQKQGDAIPAIVTTALKELRQYGVLGPEDVQGKVMLDIGLPVPLVGYFDFRWPEHGVLVDLKTALKCESRIKTEHARQVAVYKGAISDNLDARVAYATPKNIAVYGLENHRAHLDALARIGRTLERFLSISDDPADLAAIVIPDTDHWLCADERTRRNVFEVWGI